MSKNFELLRKVQEKEAARVLVAGPEAPVRAPESDALSARTASDELRKIVQQVFLSPELETAPSVVLFAAIDAGNDKNGICGRAAETLRKLVTGSICVVDANLHAPSLHQYFCVDNECGWAQALNASGRIRDFALPLLGHDLWFIPSGNGASNFRKETAAPSLRWRTGELRAEFNYVLMEGPSMNLSDAVLLGQFSDGMILIVEANSTRRETAWRVKERLKAANVKLLGAVLTEPTYPIPDALVRLL